MRREATERHRREVERNLALWERKPILRDVYRSFHQLIARNLSDRAERRTVELGSGIGNIREVIPDCIRTDLFPSPWIDRVENAYALSFAGRSVTDLILFDVFHHLRYPGTALAELHRVLVPRGRAIIFDPCLSVLGHLVYGPLHPEPVGLGREIEWLAPAGWSPEDLDYYAAQGNAIRIFVRDELRLDLAGWRVVAVERRSAISYVATGGYSKPQLYPRRALPLMRAVDRICDALPAVFATRLLVVLEKAEEGSDGSAAGLDRDRDQAHPRRQ